MKPQTFVVFLILALALVSVVSAIQIPGSNKNAPPMDPVYSGGKIIGYVTNTSGSHVDGDRIVSNATSKNGKPLWYQQKIGTFPVTAPSYVETGSKFNTPYPEGWDQNVTKFTYLEYVQYCIDHGVPKRGTFAVNLANGGWMR